MAEYVRRKRPPATHPYWARLYDRTHPPSGRGTTFSLGIIGLMSGVDSGHDAAITLFDVSRSTTRYSLYVALLFCFLGLIAGYSERDSRRPLISLGMCLFSAFFTFVVGYLIGLVFLGSYNLFFRWTTSGMGAVYGGLIGAAIGLAVARTIALIERRTWWQRQENWPKWEEMARGHRRREATLNPPAPLTDTPTLPTGTA